MATVVDQGSAVNTGTGFTTLTRSVAATTGRLLVVAATVGDAFNSAVVSGVTWNGNAFTPVEAISGGGSPWESVSIWMYEVASGTTANVVATLDKNLSQGGSTAAITVFEIAGYNTSAPAGDTSEQDGTANNDAETVTTAVDDIVISAIVCEASSGRWIAPKSGTTEDYNSDPSPGTVSGAWKMGHGSKVATGTSTSIGWDFLQTGPIPETMNFMHVAAVFQTAGGGSIVPLLHHSQRLRNLR